MDTILYPIRIAILSYISSKLSPFKVKVVCNKLLRFFIFIYNLCLHFKEVNCHISLKFFKFTGKACIYCPGNVRKILPRVDTVTPVSKSKIFVKLLYVCISAFKQTDEGFLNLCSEVIIMLGFIVYLKSYNLWMPRCML